MHVACFGQLGRARGHPVALRLAVDRSPRNIRQPAEARILVRQDDPQARCRRCRCRGEAGNAGAHHQHVAMHMQLLVAVRVAPGRCDAKAGGAANERLVDVLPEPLRPLEGLVIKAGWEEARQGVVDDAHIEVEVGPAVLAHRHQAVKELDLGGTQVRIMAHAFAHPGKRVHFLRAEPDDAARAVILEAAAEHLLAVGHHGGSERIAGKARHALAVEGEAQWLRAVDEMAVPFAQPVRFPCHSDSPLPASAGLGFKRGDLVLEEIRPRSRLPPSSGRAAAIP